MKIPSSFVVVVITIGCLHVSGIACLNIVKFVVPHYPVIENTLRLVCEYEPPELKVNLTWFKDGEPFYKYYDTKRRELFKVNGTDIDVVRSSAGTVYLNKLTAASSGLYKCSVVTNTAHALYASDQISSLAVVKRRAQPAKFSVPKTKIVGDDVVLLCDHSDGEEQEMTTKWYKDDELFYETSSPSNEKTVHDVSAVNVDFNRSFRGNVYLTDLSTNSSGSYKCESVVEEDRKAVIPKKFSDNGQMEVVFGMASFAAANTTMIACLLLVTIKSQSWLQ